MIDIEECDLERFYNKEQRDGDKVVVNEDYFEDGFYDVRTEQVPTLLFLLLKKMFKHLL